VPKSLEASDTKVFQDAEAFVVASDSETVRPDVRPVGGGIWPSSSGETDSLGVRIPGLSLAGDLRTMLLADILLWIGTRKKTGTLHVRRRSTRKQMVFHEGVLHSSSSNDPRETLGQFLVRDALITEEQLFKALLRQEEKGALLGILLVSDGLISADQLKRSLRAKAEQIVYELFLWLEGAFFFQEGRLPKNVPMNLEMDTQAVVREGNRRRNRWTRIQERFRSSEVTFKVETTPQAPLDPIERRFFELAALGKSLAEISLETRRAEYDTAEYLFSLVELNVLAIDHATDEPTAPDTVGAIEDLLERAQNALDEKRHDAAFEAYQDVLALDHLNHTAKKGLIAVSEGRKRQRLAKRVPPTSVPVVKLAKPHLTQEKLSAEESFVLSRVNGRWNVESILKLCPMGEEETLAIFARLVDRKIISLEPPPA
jgi:hypothetical protein